MTYQMSRYTVGAAPVGNSANAVQRGNAFQDKAMANINHTNAALAATLRPLHPVIDRLPEQGVLTRQWKQVFKERPLDGITLLFAPIQGIAERVVKNAIDIRRSWWINVGIPGYNQIKADLRIDPPTVEFNANGRPVAVSYPALPESTRLWVRRMRVANNFLILAYYDPVVFARANVMTLGNDISYELRKQVQIANQLAAQALGLLQQAGVPGAAQELQRRAASAGKEAVEFAKQVAQGLPKPPAPPQPDGPPGPPTPNFWPFKTNGYGVGEAATGAAAAGAAGGTALNVASGTAPVGAAATGTAATSTTTGAGTTGAATATAVSPGIVAMLVGLLAAANESGLTKEAMGASAQVLKEGPGGVKNATQMLPGGAAAANVATQAESVQSSGMSTNAKVAIGVGAGVAVLGVGYWLSKR